MEIEMGARIERLKQADPNQCLQYFASINQREKELTIEGSPNKTSGYEIAGCYSCGGHNRDCELYLSLNKLREMRK